MKIIEINEVDTRWSNIETLKVKKYTKKQKLITYQKVTN